MRRGKKFMAAHIRNWIQLSIFILTLLAGLQFYLFMREVIGGGPITIARPGGVEGFLPIGALMGWVYLFQTGVWDIIHPAAMVFLGFAAGISFVFRKTFCSWFCPVGTLSEWAWRIGERIRGKQFSLPVWIDLPLRSVKYLLLGVFLFIILSLSPSAIREFLESPYYWIVDVRMLHFFTKMTGLTAAVLIILTVLSFFIRNFWCRYACPYGALLGIFAFLGPSRIIRDQQTCTNCRQCRTVCPASLPVHRREMIRSAECSGCMDCITVCPSQDTLRFETSCVKRSWKPIQAGFLVLVTFFSLVCLAKITGHWQSRVPVQTFRRMAANIDSAEIMHPSVPSEPGGGGVRGGR